MEYFCLWCSPVCTLTILGSVGGKFDVHTKHKTLPSHSSCTRAPPSHHARSHERSRQAACSSPIFVWPRPVMAVRGGSRLPQLSACRAPNRHPRMTTFVSEFARALLDADAVLCHLMIIQSTFPPARCWRVLRADLLVSLREAYTSPPRHRSIHARALNFLQRPLLMDPHPCSSRILTRPAPQSMLLRHHPVSKGNSGENTILWAMAPATCGRTNLSAVLLSQYAFGSR